MLGRLRKLSYRVDSPLLNLLILDWRFTCAAISLAFIVLAAASLPLKLWPSGSYGLAAEAKISALDWLQAHSLMRTARAAESRGDYELAASAWAVALGNDPFDERIGLSYMKALAHSPTSTNIFRSIHAGLRLRSFSTNSEIATLLLSALSANREWERILQLTGSPEASPHELPFLVKAQFHTRRYDAARRTLATLGGGSSNNSLSAYSAGLELILAPPSLAGVFRQQLDAIIASNVSTPETIEVALTAFYEKRDLAAFDRHLSRLRSLTDKTLTFEILRARLLWFLARREEARAAAFSLAAPASARDTYNTAELLVQFGEKKRAVDLLSKYCGVFFDTLSPWLLYAQLLLEERDKDALRHVAGRLGQPIPPLSAISAALMYYAESSPRNLAQLKLALDELPRDPEYTSIWYLVADALLAAANPALATDALKRLEAVHLRNPAYYDKLFAAAEAARDADLMRRAAERRYHLSPSDPVAMGNHAAMLTIFDQAPGLAVELSAACAKAEPQLLPAQINYAAALINDGQFGPADLILRRVDQAQLPPSALNQLRFILLKRAVKLGDSEESRRLSTLLKLEDLYSRQREWLNQQNLLRPRES